jgi:hypothetical protein
MGGTVRGRAASAVSFISMFEPLRRHGTDRGERFCKQLPYNALWACHVGDSLMYGWIMLLSGRVRQPRIQPDAASRRFAYRKAKMDAISHAPPATHPARTSLG